MMKTTLTIAVLISLLFCTSLADSIADESMQLDVPKAPADAMKDSNRVKDLDQIEAKKLKVSEQAQESDVKITSDGVNEQNDENISVGEELENTENQKAETEPDTTVQNDENTTADENTEDQKAETDVDTTLENEDANDKNETHRSMKKIAVTENNLEKDETLENFKSSIQSDPEKETTVLDAVLNNAVDEEASKIEIDETKSEIPNEESIEFEAESNPETEISVQIQHSDMPDQTQEEVNVHPERTLIPVASNDVNNPIPNHAIIGTVSVDHGIPAVSHLNEAEASERNDQSFQENETLKQRPDQVVSNQVNLDASEINPKFQKMISPPIEINSDQNVAVHDINTLAPAAPIVLPNDYHQQQPVQATIENLDSNVLSWEDKPADKPELKLTPEEIDELLKLKQQGRLTEMIDRSHELKQKQTEKVSLFKGVEDGFYLGYLVF